MIYPVEWTLKKNWFFILYIYNYPCIYVSFCFSVKKKDWKNWFLLSFVFSLLVVENKWCCREIFYVAICFYLNLDVNDQEVKNETVKIRRHIENVDIDHVGLLTCSLIQKSIDLSVCLSFFQHLRIQIMEIDMVHLKNVHIQDQQTKPTEQYHISWQMEYDSTISHYHNFKHFLFCRPTKNMLNIWLKLNHNIPDIHRSCIRRRHIRWCTIRMRSIQLATIPIRCTRELMLIQLICIQHNQQSILVK